MKKSKLKIRDIVTMQVGFTLLEKIPYDDIKGRPSTKLNYAMTKTEAYIKGTVDAVAKSRKASPEFEKYSQEYIALAEKHAEKKDGKPVIIEAEKRYDIRNMDAFRKELAALDKKHKKALDQNKKQEAEIEKLLDTEEEIEIHKVSLDDLPAEMHRGIFKAIWPMILDEKE